MSYDVMMSTVDNPFDPFTDFAKWYAYDVQKGYNTCGLVARLAQPSSELSETLAVSDIESAIDDFIAIDPLHLFIKLTGPGQVKAAKRAEETSLT